MCIQVALIVAGCIFALVSILHLFRLIFKTQVMFGSVKIPLWVSVWGLIVPALLSAWMFYLVDMGCG